MAVKDTDVFQNQLPRRQVMLALAGTLLAMFLSMLYMNVVSTAMPRIITDLGGFNQYTWVFTSYFIAEVVVVLIVGKLSDMYGRKWLYIASLGVFVIGSLLSGFSQNMTQLIIFRVVQGIGGGGMMALSFIVIADLFPPNERGKWQGTISIVMAIATVIGPTIGGYLTDYLSWRWCFFINIPVGIAIIFMFFFFYPHVQIAGKKGKIDYAGALLTVPAVIPLMLALTWGGSKYDWGSSIIIILFGLSMVMFIVFFVVEHRAAEPIMPLDLLKNRVVLVSSAAVLIMGFAFSPVITFVPLFFQGVMGTSAVVSGNSMIPMMLATAVSSFLCGQILARTGGYYRLMGSAGFILMAFGLYLLSKMTSGTSQSTIMVNTVIAGIGSGLLLPLHTLAVQNTVDYAVMGAATSILSWLRTVGNLLGLSLVGAILNNRYNSSFMNTLPDDVKEVVAPETLASIVNNPQALVSPEAQSRMYSLFETQGTRATDLFDRMMGTLQSALSDALTFIFAVVLVITCLGLVVNLFLKGIPRHKEEKANIIREGVQD